MLKRITILKKEYLQRGKKGYFKEETDYIILKNATDKKIENELKNLNKNAKSRFYEICGDFKLINDKQKALFIEFLTKKYKEHRISYIYNLLIEKGLQYILQNDKEV